jgi:hypothetical protein
MGEGNVHKSINEFGVFQVREFFPAAQEFFHGHPLVTNSVAVTTGESMAAFLLF